MLVTRGPPLTLLMGGRRVTVADEAFVGSATLVAVRTTFCTVVTFAGAVYSPLAEMDPTPELIDHVTPVFEVFVTLAIICSLNPAATLELAGQMLIETGRGAAFGGS